jgi:hypothetical protein
MLSALLLMFYFRQKIFVENIFLENAFLTESNDA